MVQTFGHTELYDPACTCLDIPAIELVARRPNRIELFFAGDSMAGRRYSSPSRGNPQLVNRPTVDADLDSLLVPMRPYYSTSDIASLNLESVMADELPGPSPDKLYTFFSPTALAAAMRRNGIDHVSLGNNHTYDYLEAGLVSTLGALDAAGMEHSGAGLNVEQALRASRMEVGSERLGMLGFVGWAGDFTPTQVAAEGKGGAAHGSDDNIRMAIRRERRAGYIPIMQYHGSAEYAARPSSYSVRRMRLAIDNGAPLVSSHHPHVTEGLELYRDGLIAYSLGNFMFDQERSETQASMVMKVWLEDGEFLRAEIIPIQLLDYRPVPAVGNIRDAVLRRTMSLSAEMETYMQMSGGHIIVRSERAFRRAPPADTCNAPLLSRRTPLINGGKAYCGRAGSGEVGQDILLRGDFENTHYAAAEERFWRADDAQMQFIHTQEEGGFLRLLPETERARPKLLSSQYMRSLAPGHYSLNARIRVPIDAVMEMAIKFRPLPGAPSTARWRGESVGQRPITGTAVWQNISLDFVVPLGPEGRARPARAILMLQFAEGESAVPVDLDDVEFVRWESDPAEINGGALAWTHQRTAPLMASQR
jgi:poly-gamma-glutamate capsule biosynthesis protein CapA/YwtB (metallophosphatase superfamily)